jgi:hypothetical protein
MLIILLIALIEYSQANCVFTVVALDTVPIPPGKSYNKDKADPTPFIGSPSACPYYKDEPVCCNSVQNDQLTANF